MLINMPREAINLIMAEVKVGAGTGAESGTATSVWRIINTFKQFSWFGEIDRKIRAVVLAGGRLSVRFVRQCL
jgi:muconolactone delta-isomerase